MKLPTKPVLEPVVEPGRRTLGHTWAAEAAINPSTALSGVPGRN